MAAQSRTTPPPPTPYRQSPLEAAFALWLRQTPDIPPPQPEYEFAPPRKWRLDFAWPEQRVAVEIEGLIVQGGRHQTKAGFEDDCEKHEAALLRGWTIYRVPGAWVAKGTRTRRGRGYRMIWRPQVMATLRVLLGLPAKP